MHRRLVRSVQKHTKTQKHRAILSAISMDLFLLRLCFAIVCVWICTMTYRIPRAVDIPYYHPDPNWRPAWHIEYSLVETRMDFRIPVPRMLIGPVYPSLSFIDRTSITPPLNVPFHLLEQYPLVCEGIDIPREYGRMRWWEYAVGTWFWDPPFWMNGSGPHWYKVCLRRIHTG